MRFTKGIIIVLGCLLWLTACLEAAEFSTPAKITDGTRKYQMSRTANGIMAVDSAGTLHVTYWAGGISTTPGSPSYVLYRSWNPVQGWSEQESIDDSTYSGYHVGGRHPSLALTADESVWVVWHDQRHCTPLGNWINNTEIYGDLRPRGGSFSSTDTRLTLTSASHYGDNSYTPKIARGPDGKLNLVWYDFHYDYDVSDLFLISSDSSGVFTPVEDLSSARITNKGDRGGAPAFTVPDIAVDAAGTRHLVWVAGSGAGVDLYYGSVSSAGSVSTPIKLASAAADFYDPPHITTGMNGDVWVMYGDDTVVDQEEITILKKTTGQTSFDSPFTFPADSARQYGVDGVTDSQGRLHLVWVDEREGIQIRYGLYDPVSNSLNSEKVLTESDNYWMRPSIERDSNGNLYVLWEEDISASEGEIWFTTNWEPGTTAVEAWREY